MVYITNNHERFPQNVLEPREITISNRGTYTLYPFRFQGLYDLYHYLKANPEINTRIWPDRDDLQSEMQGFEFAGKPYDEAVEDLIADIDPGYKEFLTIEKRINGTSGKIHRYKTIKTVAGGHVNVPLYTAGSPCIYEVSRNITKPKFITVNLTLSYYWGTKKNQVFHRAIIITNIVKALENMGYSVDINAFELSSFSFELVKIDFQIKKHGQKINYQALYKSLCHVEFLRRICFRILETSDVKEEWRRGYGSTCGPTMAKQVLKLNGDDLYFDQPSEMFIGGIDIVKDFENAVEYLKLGNLIDIEKEKIEFEKKAKVLKR